MGHWCYCYNRYVETVDAEFGRLMLSIDRYGYRDNTVIIFTNHGEGSASMASLPRGICTMRQESSVSSLLSQWFARSRTCWPTTFAVGVFADFYATCCDIAGVPAPEEVRLSKSLLPLVHDADYQDRSCLVAANTDDQGRMVRDQQYKYIVYRDDEQTQLFDMIQDPLESQNLAHDPAYADVAALQQQLRDWESI